MAKGVSLYHNTKLKIKGQSLASNDLAALKTYFSAVCASDLQGAFTVDKVTCVNTSDNNGGFITYIIKVTTPITCKMKSSTGADTLIFKHLKGYKISDTTTTSGDSIYYTMNNTSYQVISSEYVENADVTLFKKGNYRLKGLDLAQTTSMAVDDLYKLKTTSSLLLNGEISSQLLDKNQKDNVVKDSSNSFTNYPTSAAVQLNGYYAKGKNINYVAVQKEYVKDPSNFNYGDTAEDYRFNTAHSFGKSYNKVKSITNMASSHTKPILIYDNWDGVEDQSGYWLATGNNNGANYVQLYTSSGDTKGIYYVPSNAQVVCITRSAGILFSNETVAQIDRDAATKTGGPGFYIGTDAQYKALRYFPDYGTLKPLNNTITSPYNYKLTLSWKNKYGIKKLSLSDLASGDIKLSNIRTSTLAQSDYDTFLLPVTTTYSIPLTKGIFLEMQYTNLFVSYYYHFEWNVAIKYTASYRGINQAYDFLKPINIKLTTDNLFCPIGASVSHQTPRITPNISSGYCYKDGGHTVIDRSLKNGDHTYTSPEVVNASKDGERHLLLTYKADLSSSRGVLSNGWSLLDNKIITKDDMKSITFNSTSRPYMYSCTTSDSDVPNFYFDVGIQAPRVSSGNACAIFLVW